MLVSLEYKAMEGQRIQAVLAAVGALPAAALVLGKEVSSGAPFFALALVTTTAAYLFWLYVDGVYYLTMAPLEREEREFMARRGYHFQHACFAYGSSSLLLSLYGLAAVHSGLTTSIPVWVGFVVTLVLALAILLHCAVCQLIRNKLLVIAAQAVERDRDRADAG